MGNGSFNIHRLVGRKIDGSPLLPLGLHQAFKGLLARVSVASADRPAGARWLVLLGFKSRLALQEGCSCHTQCPVVRAGIHVPEGLALVAAGSPAAAPAPEQMGQAGVPG